MRQLTDRVGIGWRPALAPGILAHLDEIDVLEVLLDDYVGASARVVGALDFLSRQVPLIYHGVSLGLASAHPVCPRRLDRAARSIESLRVERWSEHFAFVRAGGIEIGHLAAAPRTTATIEGTCRNLRRVKQVIGFLPALENIATLVDPPGSTLSEPEWISAIASEMSAELLIDLHNLLCNAHNRAVGPEHYLLGFPLDRASLVHLSGGRLLHEPNSFARSHGATRMLDDHLHSVPGSVFALLTLLASRAPYPLTVILERDGNYPPFDCLLDELRAARAALARGRSLTQEAALNECA
jgi:uncharacterized protein